MRSIVLRLLEMAFTSLLITVFSPIMVFVAVMILLDKGPPILYLSPRIGKNGDIFNLYYFRTMAIGPDKTLTQVGRVLRSYSLDHMPQLFNLLRGDMHIVGPRPMRPEEVDPKVEAYEQILTVKPGVFNPGVLQLGKNYNGADFDTKVDLEKAYLDQRSTASDIRFIGRVLRAVVQSRGNIKMRGEPHISNDDQP